MSSLHSLFFSNSDKFWYLRILPQKRLTPFTRDSGIHLDSTSYSTTTAA